MKSFVTGSRKYGTPRKDSDIDFVVFIESEEEYEMLVELADGQGQVTCEEEYDGQVLSPLTFGKLNLICCISEDEFQCWKDGTQQLSDRKPVTRQQAMELLAELRWERRLRSQKPSVL